MLQHRFEKPWVCTAGVWLKATELVTDVGRVDKVLWHIPGKYRVFQYLMSRSDINGLSPPVEVRRSGRSASQMRSGGLQLRTASDIL